LAGEKILIIDPDTELLENSAEKILSPYGYKPLLAYSHSEGVKLSLAKAPQLLLIHLPLDSVAQLLQRIMQKGYFAPSVVIMDQEVSSIPIELLRLGVQDYLLHPLTAEDLLLTVRRVLDRESRSLDYRQLTRGLDQLNQTLEERVRRFDAILKAWGSANSREDLDSILNRVTEAAVSITGAETGYLFLLDEKTNELNLRAAQNLSKGQVEAFKAQHEDSIIKSVVRTSKPILLSGSTGQYIEHKSNYPIKCLLNVPLKIDNRVIGVLGVDNQTANGRFMLADLRRLTELADMAAIAIANTRQYSEARQEIAHHIEQTVTLQAVTSQLSYVADFNSGAQLALSLVLKATNAEAGVLAWAPEGLKTIQYIHQGNLSGLTNLTRNGNIQQQWWDEKILQEVIRSGQSTLTQDLGLVENGKGIHNNKGYGHSRLAVPIRRQNRVIGVINLESSLPNAFTHQDLQFVTSVADQVVVALESALLQEKARLEHERLTALMGTVDNGVWMIDADLRVLAQNEVAKELLGWSEIEVIGRSVAEFERVSNHPVSSNLDQLCSQAIEKQLPVSCEEILFSTKKSTPILVKVRVVPIIHEDKGVGAFCAFHLSRRSDEHVRFEFANMASHLLRTPLTSIQASLDILLGSELAPVEQQTVLDRMRDQTKRMREFVKELLEMSRLEAGLVRVFVEPVTLMPLIERVLGLMQYEEPHHAFSFSMANSLPIVAADLAKTELVLVNLMRSALNRCSEPGHITVEVEIQNDDEVIVSISDDGEVIPVAQLDRIFSQFYPIDNTSGTIMSTYHLGLYTTKRLIELQNGRVWVESQPGKGSRFSFSLPVWR
jgi:PAS domain S-box-containing protein